ncbi:MAG: ATP-binding protein, partial [Actinomycetota bacterium]|nr:ATP-binding protein [Actinomycetota bacterium]
LVALANAEGGVIVVGIAAGQVEGLRNHLGKLNELRQAPMDFTVPPVRARFDQQRCRNQDGETDSLLVIRVDPSEVVHELTNGEVYLRVGDESRRLGFAARQELQFDKGQSQYDGQPAPGVGMDVLDDALIQNHRSRTGASGSTQQALRLEESWIGRRNREDLTPPVAELRAQVVAAGLLREYRGRLVLTRLGRQVDGDASTIWEAMAARLVPRWDVPFVRDCTVLLLLHVAAGWPAGAPTLDDVTRLLTRAGWATRDGYPVNAGQVASTVKTAHDHLTRLEGSKRPTPWGQSTTTQRAMARASLFPR